MRISPLALLLILLSATLLPLWAGSAQATNNSIATAKPIALGFNQGEVDARLTTSDELHFFRFTTEANRTYVIETYNIQGRPGTRATGLRLYNDAGTEIANDQYGNNGTGNTNARIVYTFVNPGTYYLRVSRATFTPWTGTYSLRIMPRHDEPGAGWDAQTGEPNDQLELANVIQLGRNNALTSSLFDHNSFVTANSDHDFYRFEAVTGRTYVIETFNIQGTPRSRATGIRLYNSAGTEIANDQYGNNGTGVTNARLVFTATNTATYYFLVRRAEFHEWTGTYSVRVLPKFDEPGAAWDVATSEPNDALPLAYKIEVGPEQALSRQISPNSSLVSAAGDRDFYRFDAIAGRTYAIQTFNVDRDSSGRGTGIYVYNDTGSQLANDQYGNTRGLVNAEIEFTFTTSGTYFVMVRTNASANWTGTYSLRVCDGSCVQRVFLPLVRR